MGETQSAGTQVAETSAVSETPSAPTAPGIPGGPAGVPLGATPAAAAATAQAKPFPGAVDHDGLVTFTIYAPQKKKVSLIGDFNAWNVNADLMKDLGDGLWSTTRQLERGSYCYQFVIDGEQIICDPYALYVEEDPTGGPMRAVVKPKGEAFAWQHDEYQRPAFEDLLIYEMHIADFTPERNFRGARKRLEYLRDLGVTAIELMPVFGVHEDAGWGYTPTFLFAVNRDYGTPDHLRALIDDAHGMGMAVILDMVLAHTGQEHSFNKMYAYDKSPWYGAGPKGMNQFGLPQLDYSKPATRMYVKDVMYHWLREYHVDGFRFDYVSIIGFGPEGHGIPTLTWAAREARKDAYLIAEDIPEEPREIETRSGMQGAWHVRFSHAIKALLSQKEFNGYKWAEFENSVRTLDPGREGYTRAQSMVNYVESHDEDRVVLNLTQGGFDHEAALRKSALGATVLLTAPGEPMIYEGQEWGEATPRRMDHNFIDWEKLNDQGGKGLYEHYKRMCWFRRHHPALRSGNVCIDALYPDQKCVVYRRWDDRGDVVVVVVNFDANTQKVKVAFPAKGAWKELFSDKVVQVKGEFTGEVDRWAAKVYFKA